jgi:biotin carboxylase
MKENRSKKHIAFIEASTSGAGELTCRYAQKQGYLVTLLTRNQSLYSESLLQYVDQVFEEETNDVKALVSTVQKIDKESQIDGITTTQDFYVPQAAAAAQALNLPSLNYKSALEVRNKYKMRLNLESYCPELNPLFRLVQNTDEALKTTKDWGYPIIAKPQNANDSLYVKLLRNDTELIEYMNFSQTWDSNSAQQPFAKGVLLEEFIDGEEFSVETMQAKGLEIDLIGIFSKLLAGGEKGNFIKIGASFPIVTHQSQTIFESVSKALYSLNIDCGVIHTECRIVKGKPKIIEINPRLAGDQLGSHVIELSLGINPVQAVVDIALGEVNDWQPIRCNGVAIYRICASKPGYFYGIENIEELKKLPGVAYIEIVGKIGKWFDLPTSNQDVLASVITKGETPEQALILAKRIADEAKLKIYDHEC